MIKRRDYQNVCTCGRAFMFTDELEAHCANAQHLYHRTAITVFTCDSHETYGPFESEADALWWARARGLSSYTIHT